MGYKVFYVGFVVGNVVGFEKFYLCLLNVEGYVDGFVDFFCCCNVVFDELKVFLLDCF